MYWLSIKLPRQTSGTQFVIICGGMQFIGYLIRDASVTETSLTALLAVDAPRPCIIGRGKSRLLVSIASFSYTSLDLSLS